MKIRCSGCGKTLNVPDAFAGRKVACPVCKKSILVPDAPGGGTSAPARPPVASDSGAVRPHGAGRGNAAPPSAAEPSSRKAPERCPSCGAPLIAGAVLCTFCGYDLRNGRKVLGAAKEPLWPRISGLLGPIAALVLVVAAGRFLLSGGPAGDEDTGNSSGARPRAEQVRPPSGPVPETPLASGGPFRGGPVKGVVELSGDASPYRLEQDAVLAGGSILKIGAGVRIEGEGAIRGAGKLLLQGKSDAWVQVAVPVRLEAGDGSFPGLRAEWCIFLRPVSLKVPAEVSAGNAFFEAGLDLELDAAGDGKAVVRLEKSRLGGEDPVLRAEVRGNMSQVEFVMKECDVLGKVEGRIGAFSAVDFRNCYWKIPPETALAGLSGAGDKRFAPALDEPVTGKGNASELPPAAGPAFSLETPLVSLPIPPGWDRGGEVTAWKQTPQGSIVVSLLEERVPKGSIETFLEFKKRRLRSVDKHVSLKEDWSPLLREEAFSEYRFDIDWEGTPYVVLFHVTSVERENKVAGVAVTLPKSLWSVNKDALSQLLASLERKEG